MSVNGAQTGVACYQCSTAPNCTSANGCASGVADFCIKRHDTKPDFMVSVSDCNGPMDLSDPSLVLEVNMWAKGKLKSAIAATDTYFALADNIGFNQIMVGDIIVMDRVRRPEEMLVTGFDETNYLVSVTRGYNSTDVSAWKKGSCFRIFRILNGVGQIVSTNEDITQEDGTTKSTLTDTSLVYQWNAQDTCLPGCYYLEFKLLSVLLTDSDSISNASFTPSSYTPADFGCDIGDNVAWVRRFPSESGFVIRILDTPTQDSI